MVVFFLWLLALYHFSGSCNSGWPGKPVNKKINRAGKDWETQGNFSCLSRSQRNTSKDTLSRMLMYYSKSRMRFIKPVEVEGKKIILTTCKSHDWILLSWSELAIILKTEKRRNWQMMISLFFVIFFSFLYLLNNFVPLIFIFIFHLKTVLSFLIFFYFSLSKKFSHLISLYREKLLIWSCHFFSSLFHGRILYTDLSWPFSLTW